MNGYEVKVQSIIAATSGSQVQVGKRLGVSQPTVSAW